MRGGEATGSRRCPWRKTPSGSAAGSGRRGRMVLWAHNYHVSTQPDRAGPGILRRDLRRRHGRRGVQSRGRVSSPEWTCVPATGTATAVIPPSTSSIRRCRDRSSASSPGAKRLPPIRSSTSATATTSALRRVPGSREERLFRSIGCCYRPSMPDRYWRPGSTPRWRRVVRRHSFTSSGPGPTTVLPYRLSRLPGERPPAPGDAPTPEEPPGF